LKAVLALGTAAKEFLKEGKPLNTALGDTLTQIKKLQDAGNNVDADKLANKIFGAGIRGGGATIISALQEGLDPQALDKLFKPAGENIDQLYEKTKHAAGAWQEVKNSIEAALEPASTGLHKFVDEKLTGLSEWVGQHKQEIVTFFVDVAKAGFGYGSGPRRCDRWSGPNFR